MKFFKRIFEVSESFPEFSMVWLGAGLAFMQQESPELPNSIINQMVDYYIDKNRARKFGEVELIYLYKLFDMKNYNTSVTFVVLAKDKLEALEWIKTSANLKTIALGHLPIKVTGPTFHLSL